MPSLPVKFSCSAMIARLPFCTRAFWAREVYVSNSWLPQPPPPRSYVHLLLSGVAPSACENSSDHDSTQPEAGGNTGGCAIVPPPQLLAAKSIAVKPTQVIVRMVKTGF